MTCKIDHGTAGTFPAFLCRTCHPELNNPTKVIALVMAPEEVAAPTHGRKDLPKTMTPEAWAILEAQERSKKAKQQEALQAYEAKKAAERAELGDAAYLALQRAKRRAKKATVAVKQHKRRRSRMKK